MDAGMLMQVIDEAGQIDQRADSGEDIGPLCGLAVVVKDLYDVANYTTAAGTPSLAGEQVIKYPPGSTLM